MQRKSKYAPAAKAVCALEYLFSRFPKEFPLLCASQRELLYRRGKRHVFGHKDDGPSPVIFVLGDMKCVSRENVTDTIIINEFFTDKSSGSQSIKKSCFPFRQAVSPLRRCTQSQQTRRRGDSALHSPVLHSGLLFPVYSTG